MIGTAYDKAPAELLIHYKSNSRHRLDISVADARQRTKQLTHRRSVLWMKVTIPVPNSNNAIVCLWERNSGWTRKVVQMPVTKD